MGRKAPGLAAAAAFLLISAACGGNTATTTQTDVGVTSNSILLGTTIALSGPAAAYGTIANAENAYFTYVNNTQIGVLYQNDDYGQDYLKGLTDGLGDKASMIVAKESYDVTAADPFAQLTKLKAAGVDTLFLFSTPKPSIQSLAFVSKVAWTPTIYLNSVSNPQVYLLAGVQVTTTSSDHFPIMQEQVITWSGALWQLQGSIIDERGSIK